jgi:hypothetical protein
MEHCRNDITGEKPKYLEKKQSQCPFVHYRYHMN